MGYPTRSVSDSTASLASQFNNDSCYHGTHHNRSRPVRALVPPRYSRPSRGRPPHAHPPPHCVPHFAPLTSDRTFRQFIRAYLEATGTQYVEPVKDGDYSEMAPYMSSSATSDSPTTTAFAPPALLHSGNLISQTSAILGYLEAVLPPIDLQLRNGAGEETKTTEPGEVWARQALMQTIADCVAEVS